MIVDSHVHIWADGWRPRWNQAHTLTNVARARGISADEAMRFVEKTWDPDGSGLIAEMDLIGLDKALVFRVPITARWLPGRGQQGSHRGAEPPDFGGSQGPPRQARMVRQRGPAQAERCQVC